MPRKRLTREESRARTRGRILDAAARLFVRHGFDGTPVDGIAAAAGYTKGAFYANFECKEDVFLALMERHGRESGAARHEMLAPGPGSDGMEAAIRQHAREHAHDWDWLVLGIEFKLAAARNPKLRSRLAATRRVLIAGTLAVLEGFSARMGRSLSVQPELLCTAAEALIEGLALLHKVDAEAVSAERVDAIMDLFVDRMLLHGGPPGGK